jgi:hypothetical protein
VLSPIATALSDRVTWLRLGPLCEGASHSHTQALVNDLPNRLDLVPGPNMSCPILGNEGGMAWIYLFGAVALP